MTENPSAFNGHQSPSTIEEIVSPEDLKETMQEPLFQSHLMEEQYDLPRADDTGHKDNSNLTLSSSESGGECHKTSQSLDWTFLNKGQLYDRQQQIDQLHDALDDLWTPFSPSELILISGTSGTGKTVLAKTLNDVAVERNGFFVLGKFDQLNRGEPYEPLVAAITEFIELTLARGADFVESTRQSILETVGREAGLLTNMIPALEKLIGTQEACVAKGADAHYQVKLLFRKFMYAACTQDAPLVIVMDDLQWADSGSLDLIEALISDKQHSFLAVVGVCRSNEVAYVDDFASMLRRLEDEKNTKITNIELQSISFEAINNLVADVLNMPKEDCTGLSNAVQTATGGNAFFIMQFLNALHEEGLLFPNESGGWEWNEKLWTETYQEQYRSLLDVVLRRVKRLPSDCQWMLSTAACLGSEFDESLLEKILPEVHVKETLREALHEGLITRQQQKGYYRFVHDKIQQTAYCLIPDDERPAFSLSIGERLWHELSQEDLEVYLFTVVNQIIAGVSHLDAQDNEGLACLCLQAGQKAAALNDFKTATMYFEFGLSLLDKRRLWKDDYDLCLMLHNSIAEAACSAADFDRMDKALSSILHNARNFTDKLRARSTKIYSLAALQLLPDALDLGLDTLKQLGERFPKKLSKPRLLAAVVGTKLSLRNKSDAQLLNLPDIDNPEKLAALSFLNLLSTYAFIARPALFPFIALRMIELSLKYGLCAVSAQGFASYGILLCAIGDTEGGYRFGRVALSILDRYESIKKEWVSRIHTVFYGLIAHWKIPLRDCRLPLEQAHLAGLRSGDHEYGMVSLYMLSMHSFVSGLNLASHEKRLRWIKEEMATYRQVTYTDLISLQLEITLILMGRTNDPEVSNGVLMGTMEQEKMDSKSASYIVMACIFKMIIGYLYDNLELALAMAEKSRQLVQAVRSSYTSVFQAFYDIMTSLKAARVATKEKNRRKMIALARTCFKRFRKTIRKCPDNLMLHFTSLIEAEFAVLSGRISLALSLYDTAEACTSEYQFNNLEAIACERAGLTLLEFGDPMYAKESFQRAVSAYTKWGADGKRKQLLGFMETNLSLDGNKTGC